MLYAFGYLQVAQNAIRIKINDDFLRYYCWLIKKEFRWLKLQYPKHGAHITISNKKLHKNVDYNKIKALNGARIRFQYDEKIIQGGCEFVNFWVPVECKFAEYIKERLNIVDKGFLGFHITICNNKKSYEF